MPNWNSATKSWSPVRGAKALALEAEARRLAKTGATIKQIAARLNRSEPRVREYLHT